MHETKSLSGMWSLVLCNRDYFIKKVMSVCMLVLNYLLFRYNLFLNACYVQCLQQYHPSEVPDCNSQEEVSSEVDFQ